MKNIDTLILAGGKSSRLNYVDKLELKINNDKILDLVIQNAINKVYVVGDKKPTKINVTWINDLTINGGPGVGVWSGLQEINSDYVLILAGDQPFIGHYVTELCQKATGNGSWLVDEEGMGNPLASCVKVSALKSSLEESGGVNVSLRQILGKMDLVPITVADDVVQDLDTWADVAKVMRESGNMTDAWIKNIAKKLDLNHEVLDVEKILDLTRDVAHNVERKVAPLTTFLLGYAAGKGNLARKEIEELVEKINASIKEWQEKKVMSNNFSHLNNEGKAHMVDVSKKPITLRTSKARCVVEFKGEVSKLIKENNLPKGDLFSTVRIAGIMASKKVSELIPLCHPLSIDAISIEIQHKDNTLIITSDVKIEDKTGVEMEALTAVTVSGLTAIDMIKSVDPSVKIMEVKLLEKTGGKSGHWINPK